MLSPLELWVWFADPATWEGRYGLINLLAEHMALTWLSILLAATIAVPIGVLVGHFSRGEVFVVLLSSASRAIPTMGLLFALVMLFGITARELAVVLALTAIAVPPLLAGAYSGIMAIPKTIREAARAQGMTHLQMIFHVELPIASAAILGGLRVGFIQVVSTVVLAPLVGLGGLGFGIIQGLALRDFAQVTGSAAVIVVVTVFGDRLIGLVQKASSVRLNNKQETR